MWTPLRQFKAEYVPNFAFITDNFKKYLICDIMKCIELYSCNHQENFKQEIYAGGGFSVACSIH